MTVTQNKKKRQDFKLIANTFQNEIKSPLNKKKNEEITSVTIFPFLKFKQNINVCLQLSGLSEENLPLGIPSLSVSAQWVFNVTTKGTLAGSGCITQPYLAWHTAIMGAWSWSCSKSGTSWKLKILEAGWSALSNILLHNLDLFSKTFTVSSFSGHRF